MFMISSQAARATTMRAALCARKFRKGTHGMRGISTALPEVLRSNLMTQYGITDPTRIQSETLPLALEGHSLLCSAPTGTGKTLCYLLPLLARLIDGKIPPARSLRPRALVLVPTI